MLKILSLTVTVVLVLLFVVALIGYAAPAEYSGSLTERFEEKTNVVWKSIVSIEDIPENKRDVESVEILSNSRGLYTWKENLSGEGFRIYGMTERREPYRIVLELKESTNGLHGTWTYTLEDLGEAGTNLTIAEESTLDKVFVRGLQTIQGRDINLIRAMKSVRVGLLQRLLHEL